MPQQVQLREHFRHRNGITAQYNTDSMSVCQHQQLHWSIIAVHHSMFLRTVLHVKHRNSCPSWPAWYSEFRVGTLLQCTTTDQATSRWYETVLSMSCRQLLLHGHQCRRSSSSRQRSPQQRISVFARNLLTNRRMRIHCRHRKQSTMSTIDSLVECRDASTHHTIAQLDIIGGTVQQSKQNVVALSSVQ